MLGVGFGCLTSLTFFLGGLALQALFLNLGAKLAGVESHYSKAVKAVLLYLVFAAPVILGSVVYLVHQSPGQVPVISGRFLLILAIECAVAGTFAVLLVFKVSIVRALLTYVASIVLSTMASVAFYAILFGVFWLAMGSEEFNREFQAEKSAFFSAWQQQLGNSGTELLSPVEDTEMENAFDIELASADRYIRKTVRVIHGPRSETIGTLVRSTPDKIFVKVKLEGGRVEIPISKSKITTFQIVEE